MCTSHETVKLRNGGREICKSGETETWNDGAPERSPTDSHPRFNTTNAKVSHST